MNILKALFGNYSKKELKRIQPICDKVLALEDKYAAMSESELKNQTAVLKERLANGETTDDILPDAFAVCREGAWRVLGMKHYPVQIIGGIVLHQGRIAEMKTGEGKTLVATLPAYLNGLTGEGVHIVTVNDYLARRDSEWMGKLYRYLGLTTGLIVHSLDNEGRKRHTKLILHTVQTTNSDLTISVIIWLFTRSRKYSVATLTQLSTRLTQSLLMRQEHLLLFQDRVESLLSYMNCVMCLQDSLLKVHIMVKELRCRL